MKYDLLTTPDLNSSLYFSPSSESSGGQYLTGDMRMFGTSDPRGEPSWACWSMNASHQKQRQKTKSTKANWRHRPILSEGICDCQFKWIPHQLLTLQMFPKVLRSVHLSFSNYFDGDFGKSTCRKLVKKAWYRTMSGTHIYEIHIYHCISLHSGLGKGTLKTGFCTLQSNYR